MKKIILIGLLFVTLFGCTKKLDINPKVDPNLNPKVVSITVGDKTSNFVLIEK